MRYLALIALVTMAFGCKPQELISNPVVDRWCGERPCSWEVQGEIARIGTWHERDYAVSFVSDDAALTQLNAMTTARVHDCYEFTMIAKVDAETKLFLELDFLDDGDVELSQRIPESDWDLRTFRITTPTWYEGVRFIVRKEGTGYAALAQLSAQAGSSCTTAPLDLRHRPTGALCEHDEQCASEGCEDRKCAGCLDADDCDEGQLCGYVLSEVGSTRDCIEEASAPLGVRCSDDAQCQSDVCCDGVCSSCCGESPGCPGVEVCGPSPQWAPGLSGPRPQQCAPGEGTAQSGDPCVDDTDCEGARCEGVEWVCTDMCDDCFVCGSSAVVSGTCD